MRNNDTTHKEIPDNQTGSRPQRIIERHENDGDDTSRSYFSIENFKKKWLDIRMHILSAIITVLPIIGFVIGITITVISGLLFILGTYSIWSCLPRWH